MKRRNFLKLIGIAPIAPSVFAAKKKALDTGIVGADGLNYICVSRHTSDDIFIGSYAWAQTYGGKENVPGSVYNTYYLDGLNGP